MWKTKENKIMHYEAQYSYSPFGLTEVYGEQSDNPFQYTGRENDGTGLYYYRARYYDPQAGRFISEDPIGFVGGINFYSYVGNRPTYWIDPMGLTPPIWGPDPKTSPGGCPQGVNCVDPGPIYPIEEITIPRDLIDIHLPPIYPRPEAPEYPEHYDGRSYDGPGCGGGTRHLIQDYP